MPDGTLAAIESEVDREIEAAVRFAGASPPPDPGVALEGSF